jgi:GntR family transcriptional regulator/MocR family aminotransferase
LIGHLRDLILSGGISPGARLPAQRLLARDLRISRNTVVHAYEALRSEGLVDGQPGAGTFVVYQPLQRPALRQRSEKKADAPEDIPFQQGVPDVSLFPRDVWARLQARRWRTGDASILGHGETAGWFELRAILAQRVSALRGVRCSASQVIIVSSAMAGLQLVCAALGVAGRQVLAEGPSFPGVRAVLQGAGAKIVSAPVDENGLDVSAALIAAPDALLAYTTPATQFPTGVTLSLPRRQALTAWARASGSWIIEDDYESDFVFEGDAPPALAAEAASDRVIYLATLNNVLFPSLGIAYLVAPDVLLDRLLEARRHWGGVPHIPTQMTLHDFMDGGHLASHIRQCRDIYRERRDSLRILLRERLGDLLELRAQPAGLHVSAWLKGGLDGRDAREIARRAQLVLHAMLSSGLPERNAHQNGIYLGYAGYSKEVLARSVDLLDRALRARSLRP